MIPDVEKMLYRRFLKRILDVVVSSLVVVALLPVFLAVTIVLIFVNEGNPFFMQDRPGRYTRRIRIIKFKSMTDKRDANGELLPDKQRMTGFGNFIRRTSLDELPQLINVLRGDMSLVGPRPLLFKYLPLYSTEQMRRHEVRPGITGWAQVNGRNSISWTEKFKHDVYYIENLSFTLDVKILWFTILKVLKKEGVNQTEDRPMLPFNGHN